MLDFISLKNHAGIELVGDYDSLRKLHQVIHEVNEASPLVDKTEGAFLGLAYDVRKAYEGKREVHQPPEQFKEMGPRYGVKILWPVILWQSRVLRESLAYMSHGSLQQAIAYALEAVIEQALVDDFHEQAPALISAWKDMQITQNSEMEMEARSGLFSTWNKEMRKDGLIDLLLSFNPMYGWSHQLLDKTTIEAWKGPDIRWPDPKW